jgi:hypothetical protein
VLYIPTRRKRAAVAAISLSCLAERAPDLRKCAGWGSGTGNQTRPSFAEFCERLSATHAPIPIFKKDQKGDREGVDSETPKGY